MVVTLSQVFYTKWSFTLCGGHISPILTACKEIGIQVINVCHEITAVFVADAISRLSGKIGVAVVTAAGEDQIEDV